MGRPVTVATTPQTTLIVSNAFVAQLLPDFPDMYSTQIDVFNPRTEYRRSLTLRVCEPAFKEARRCLGRVISAAAGAGVAAAGPRPSPMGSVSRLSK